MPPPSAVEMVIPAHAVGKVMGKGGTNIENIRKVNYLSVDVAKESEIFFCPCWIQFERRMK